MPFKDKNSSQSWENRTTPSLIKRTGVGFKSLDNEVDLSKFPGGYPFDQNKNYQFITKVKSVNSGTIEPLVINLNNPFNIATMSVTRSIGTSSITYYSYAVPNSSESNKVLITYSAESDFTTCGIDSSKMNDIDIILNGYREFSYDDIDFNDISQPSGWVYTGNNTISIPDTNAGNTHSFSYEWLYNSSAISPSFSTFGVGNNQPVNINYLAKLLDYDTFNLKLDYETNSNTSGISIYIVKSNRLNNESSWVKVASLTQSVISKEWTGLNGNTNGIKNYLIISASSSNQFNCRLSNIFIYGGYHARNNRQYLLDNMEVDIPSASYQFNTNEDGIKSNLTSKIGNGIFRSGIWENGVWNNGWRDDTISQDLDNIDYSILTNSDVSWKIKIVGPISSIKNGNVFRFIPGDKVTIGNIVAIDINDNRKLLKSLYTIESCGVDTIGSRQVGYIIVNLDTTFPYRRIERDSPNHKVKVTKNIWLSGAFFNGYFSGVWNNGLFRGYPLLTEMFDTHWIDGFFNGGHFDSKYQEFVFNSISSSNSCSVGYTSIEFNNGHNIKENEFIFIKFNDIDKFNAIGITNNYYGLIKVLSVDGNKIIINRIFGGNTGITISDIDGLGVVQKYTGSGLIQNFKFYDNNRSKVKSSESNISSSVFNYNSWIDVNYDNSRSVTLGRDFRAYETLTGKSINRNNLFGYPTYDVLSSVSRFRDSNSLDVRLYKLGTKYKVFDDFIGEFSEFNEPFNPDINMDNFFLGGWTYSYINKNNIRFDRTESIISVNDINAQNYIDSGVTGDELFIYATSSGAIINNSKLDINKGRYSVIEFDIITHSVVNTQYTFKNLDIFSSNSLLINSPSPITNTLNNDNISNSIGIISLGDNLSPNNDYDFNNGFGFSLINSCSTIVKLSDGSLIVGGYQTSYNGYTLLSKYITKINQSGSVDIVFDSNFGDILTGIPIKMVVDNLDNIYIASPGIDKLIKISSNGVVDSSFNIKMSNSSNISDIELTSNNNIIIIGSFATFSYGISNTVVSRNKVARILQNGQNDTSFNPGIGFGSTDTPLTIALDNYDNIFIGGNIRKYNSVSNNINGLVKISINGSKDFDFLSESTDGFLPSGTSINATVKKILFDSDSLYVGGSFTELRSQYDWYINRLAKIDSTYGYVDPSFSIDAGFNKAVGYLGIKDNSLFVSCVSTGAKYKNIDIKNGLIVLNKETGNLISTCSDDFSTTPAYGSLSMKVNSFIFSDNGLVGVGPITGYSSTLKEITSMYSIAQSLGDSVTINSIDVLLNISQTEINDLTINLKSPSGQVINLMRSGDGMGSSMINSIFTTHYGYPLFEQSIWPYSGKFRMDKYLNLGNTMISNVTSITETDIIGNWTLYVMDNNSLSSTEIGPWSITFNYDLYNSDFINNEPLARFPIINFSNLNYEISTQLSGTQTVQVYKKMNYLPISDNINHLLTSNTFRLDSIESATPEQWGGFGKNLQTKKFEYFYNKTDMMMSISGNGFMGASSSTVVLDNIKTYEIDMIPFFKYFNDNNIYKGVQVPLTGVAPDIDYLDADFIFVDNISIGLDSINVNVVVNELTCEHDIIDINDFTINMNNITLSGVAIGTQDILGVTASLQPVITTTTLVDYIAIWKLDMLVINGNGNSGNSPSINLSNLLNNTVYTLSLTIIYAGIEHTNSCTITIGAFIPTTTLPTTTLPTTTLPPTVSTYLTINSSSNSGCVVTVNYSTDLPIGSKILLKCILQDFGLGLPNFSTPDPLYGDSFIITTTGVNNIVTFTLLAGSYYRIVLTTDDILLYQQIGIPPLNSNIVSFENANTCSIYTPNSLIITNIALTRSYIEEFFMTQVNVYRIYFTTDAPIPTYVLYNLNDQVSFIGELVYTRVNNNNGYLELEIGTFLQAPPVNIRLKIGNLTSNNYFF